MDKFAELEQIVGSFLGDLERLGDLSDVLDREGLDSLNKARSSLEFVSEKMDGSDGG